MITESEYELNAEEKRKTEELLNRVWTFLNDVIEKNEGQENHIPEKLIERFRCVNELKTWIQRGMSLES